MIDLIINLSIPALLMIIGYGAGSYAEKLHFKSIRDREEKSVDFETLNFTWIRPDTRVERSDLVAGSVVVSLDYFKRFLAALRGIIGGRITAYEPLLDRGRREAMLRMKEEAKVKGYDSVLNVRFESSALASSRRDGKGNVGIEIIAYGTAIRYQNHER